MYADELKSKNEALFDAHDFLWGWLVGVVCAIIYQLSNSIDGVVNTRSLYMDIFRRKLPLSNLTLCPLIDFANHTSSVDLPRAKWKDAPKSARDDRGRGEPLKPYNYVFLPPDQIMEEGDELFLRYGEHNNGNLFSEYGFVDEGASQEADVSDVVNDIINKKRCKELVSEVLPAVASQFMRYFCSFNPKPLKQY